MTSNIRAIIFDMGGVLIKPNEKQIGSRIARSCRIRPKKLVAIAFDSVYEDELCTGKINAYQYWKKICKKAGINYTKRIADRWIGEYRAPVNSNVMRIVEKLKKKYIVASITDVSKTRAAYHKKHGLYRHFRFVVFSCYARVRKPHKKIYFTALRRLRVAPAQCLFIDDKKKNVAGARSVGMNGIVFKNAAQLKRELAKHGIVL